MVENVSGSASSLSKTPPRFYFCISLLCEIVGHAHKLRKWVVAVNTLIRKLFIQTPPSLLLLHIVCEFVGRVEIKKVSSTGDNESKNDSDVPYFTRPVQPGDTALVYKKKSAYCIGSTVRSLTQGSRFLIMCWHVLLWAKLYDIWLLPLFR